MEGIEVGITVLQKDRFDKATVVFVITRLQERVRACNRWSLDSHTPISVKIAEKGAPR